MFCKSKPILHHWRRKTIKEIWYKWKTSRIFFFKLDTRNSWRTYKEHWTTGEFLEFFPHESFRWPTINHDIQNYVKKCHTCNQINVPTFNTLRNNTILQDWQVSIIKYLTHGGIKGQQGLENEQELTANANDIYFMGEGELQRKYKLIR